MMMRTSRMTARPPIVVFSTEKGDFTYIAKLAKFVIKWRFFNRKLTSSISRFVFSSLFRFNSASSLSAFFSSSSMSSTSPSTEGMVLNLAGLIWMFDFATAGFFAFGWIGHAGSCLSLMVESRVYRRLPWRIGVQVCLNLNNLSRSFSLDFLNTASKSSTMLLENRTLYGSPWFFIMESKR